MQTESEAVQPITDKHVCDQSLVVVNVVSASIDVCQCTVCGEVYAVPLPRRF